MRTSLGTMLQTEGGREVRGRGPRYLFPCRQYSREPLDNELQELKVYFLRETIKVFISCNNLQGVLRAEVCV